MPKKWQAVCTETGCTFESPVRRRQWEAANDASNHNMETGENGRRHPAAITER